MSGCGWPHRDVSERDDLGQVGGVEGLVFGVLVFLLGMLVIANAWGVIDTKQAVESAAQEGVRAVVQSPQGSDPAARATAAAADVLKGAGRDTSRMSVVFSGQVVRCAILRVHVSYRLPLVSVPLLGGVGSGLVVSGQQSERLDPYRSGLPVDPRCG